MQLLSTTLNRLAGKPHKKFVEVDDFYIQLKPEDLLDSVINIAAGIRWFSHKYQLLLRDKRVKDKGLWPTIKYYHSWRKEGDIYEEKIKGLYNSSR